MPVRRRFFAPAFLQTTAMDCGPASLASVLCGVGINVGFERLREVCQTDVDGTSIDALEDVANALGLPLRQLVLPIESVFDAIEALAPCIVVTRAAGGYHFIVCWRRLGPILQVMDPGSGRSWIGRKALERRLANHSHETTMKQLRKLLGAQVLRRWFRRREQRLGLSLEPALFEQALAAPTVGPLAAFDGALGLVDRLVRGGAVRPGRDAQELFEHSFHTIGSMAESANPSDRAVLARLAPSAYLFPSHLLRPSAVQAGPSRPIVSGAVVLGLPKKPQQTPAAVPASQAAVSETVLRTMQAPSSAPWREIWRLLHAGGHWLVAGLLGASFLTVIATLTEALLFRAALEAPSTLVIGQQRLTGAIAVLVFLVLVLAIEFGLARGSQRLGETVEARVRLRLFQSLPHISSSYFASRPVSDMAERAHALFQVRRAPRVFFQLARTAIDAGLTVAAIALLDATSGGVALAGAAICAAVFWVGRLAMADREEELLTHNSALNLVYRDALSGGVALRAHGGENNLRQAHELRLVRWFRSTLSHTRLVAWLVACTEGATAATVIATVFVYHARHADVIGLLLLLFWVQRIPAQVQTLMTAILTWPHLTRHLVRALDPLRLATNDSGATETAESTETAEDVDSAVSVDSTVGVSIEVEDVAVRAGGHDVLRDLSVTISPGEHVAIVGCSGAGKSSFVRLLLGLLEGHSGSVRVDGRPLNDTTVRYLHQHTAWVDPKVQIWNRSLFENLRFGNETRPPDGLVEVMKGAELEQVARSLPRNILTSLGDGGCLVSGGEGQRVRCGRALFARDARFVVLDEPFRGLESAHRVELLKRARRIWKDATLLFVTHDTAEAQAFSRVIVFDRGALVEDGSPSLLRSRPNGWFCRLAEAHAAVNSQIWQNASWRRWHVERGRVRDEGTG